MSSPYRRLLELADYLTTQEGKVLYKSHYEELLQYRRELRASGWGDRDTTLSEMREDARGVGT